MKKLLLIRHAKAEPGDKDFKRRLSERGFRDALSMGAQLKEKQLVPDLVLTSTSYRTKATADIIAEAVNIKNKQDNQDIYEANTFTLLNIITDLPDEYNFVALVGHNPGMSQILYELTGEMLEMPTCGMALVTFDFDEWDMVTSDVGKLSWFGSPKEQSY